MANQVVLETRNLTKRFPGVVANENIGLKIHQGEIMAIMGENGAGKSTLCNMITGILQPTEGEILFKGRKVELSHPSEALKLGIRMVYQERNLIEYLTGAQSICLGMEDRTFSFFVSEKKMRKRAQAISEQIGVNVPLDVPVEHLTAAQQQMIEILRAVAYNPELLILDEPTAALGIEEVKLLFKAMRGLQALGVAIVLITHKLDEVFEIADTITILRNGKLVETVANGAISRTDAVRMMLGKDISSQFPPVENTARPEIMLEISGLADKSGKLKNVGLNVKKGEVVGLYGLLGSGRTEVLEAIYGLRARSGGEIRFDGKSCSPKLRASDMIKLGMFLVPEDRRHLSLFRDFYKIRENLSIGYLDRVVSRLRIASVRKEKKLFTEIAANPGLRVVYARDNQDIEELSGGNQQKIVIGRWIFRENIKLILMDEPTQGIDVGVKHDIYVLIRKLAAEGKSVLIVSSELPELTGVCDRLYIIHEGQVKAEFARDQFNNEKTLEMLL